MPFAWTAIYLMNIVTGGGSMERETSVEKTMDVPDTGSRAASLGMCDLVVDYIMTVCLTG